MKSWALLLVLAACRSGPPQAPVSAPSAHREISLNAYEDRIRGAWLGQMIGSCVGTPYAFTSNGVRIAGALAPWSPERLPESCGREELALGMVFLLCLEARGPEVTPLDAGRDLAASLCPLGPASARGRDLLRLGVLPPWSGHPVCNGEFEDAGYQAGSEAIGLVCPGLPREAHRLSQVFGRLMSHGDGLTGGMLTAGMIAEAVLQDDPRQVRRVVEAGLLCIPGESPLAGIVRDLLARHAGSPGDWEGAWEGTEAAMRGFGPACRAASARASGAYVVLSLLYGGGDFDRTVEIAVRCGRGTSGNAASACGVLGAVLGWRRLAARCLPDAGAAARLRETPFPGTPYTLDGACRAAVDVARRIATRGGGGVADSGGKVVFQIPRSAAVAPSDERRALFEAERERLHDIRIGPLGTVFGWDRRGDILFPKAVAGSGDPAGLEAAFDLAEPASVRLTPYLRRRRGAGRVRFILDGNPVGAPLDLGGGNPLVVVQDLGAHKLTAGRHTVRIESADGRRFEAFGLDVQPG